MNSEQELLKADEVCQKLNFSKVSLYRRIKDQNFPKPLKTGPRSSRWRWSEITAWLDSLERGCTSGE